MLGGHVCRFAEGLLPAAYGLAGQGAHEVDVDVVKAGCAGGFVAGHKIACPVDPAQICQFFIVHGLETEAEAVNTSLPERSQLVCIHGSGVAFDGDLRVFSYIKDLIQGLHQAGQLPAAHQRWGAAAKENRLYLIAAAAACQLRCPETDFFLQPLYIGCPYILRCGP